ncbi:MULTISPECIES: recombinase family protein [Mameliella]|nr:recombinase family protein [Mameliella alba]MCR9275464.1 recombinase family protein [Paracoccaceae bacterium]
MGIGKIIAYERVSTARQGRSGLGLEAQRSAIEAFAASRSAGVLARFTEVESGKRNTRPELDKALNLARLTGATLVIAKLDRLSRDAAFLLNLQASGVSFLACDMPEANDLTVGIMALVAQQERETISRRTKEALAAAKARGVKPRKPQRRGGAQAGGERRDRAAGNGQAQRRRVRRGSVGGGCGDPCGRSHDSACHGGATQRARYPDAPLRAMACLDRAEPAWAIRNLLRIYNAARTADQLRPLRFLAVQACPPSCGIF